LKKELTRISENKKKYNQVIEQFDDYFKVRKNLIYERVHFNKRNQLPNESMEQFITEVHKLGDSCKFGLEGGGQKLRKNLSDGK